MATGCERARCRKLKDSPLNPEMLKGEAISNIMEEKEKYKQLYLNEVKRFNVCARALSDIFSTLCFFACFAGRKGHD